MGKNVNNSPSFASVALDRKQVLIACLAVTVVIVMLVSLISPKKYQATARILAEPQKEDNPYLLDVRSQQERKMFLETQKEIFISNAVLTKALSVIEKKPEQSVAPSEIQSFLAKVTISSRSSMGKTTFTGNGIGESNMFFVQVTDVSPEKAAVATNALVNAYLDVVSKIRSEQARSTVAMLDSAVQETSATAKRSLERISQFSGHSNGLLPELFNVGKSSIRLFPELEFIRREYEDGKAEIAKKKALIASLEKTLQSSDALSLPSDYVNYPIVIAIKTKISNLKTKLSEVRTSYNDSAREVMDVREKIKDEENAFRSEIEIILTGERESLAAMEKAQQELANSLASYDNKMSQLIVMNSMYAEYLGLAKALDLQVQKMAEAQIAASKRTASATSIVVLDWAAPNPLAVSPKLMQNLIISIVLGLGIGLFLILMEFITSQKNGDDKSGI
ncbi:MAG TPA: Wzz/FepE/Etk N-terminal domain-containing protein [Candidatus Sumerlaeota bacterium]|nr:Wzz/FepE/Etk N-terminal domain-containing protein [Candidatus Sumerlaeota bacterium]